MVRESCLSFPVTREAHLWIKATELFFIVQEIRITENIMSDYQFIGLSIY